MVDAHALLPVAPDLGRTAVSVSAYERGNGPNTVKLCMMNPLELARTL
jgi:hypothetical protein